MVAKSHRVRLGNRMTTHSFRVLAGRQHYKVVLTNLLPFKTFYEFVGCREGGSGNSEVLCVMLTF